MENFAVILIFVLCLVLLLIAYLFTVVRCSMCCWRGIRSLQLEQKEEKPDTEVPTFTLVVEDQDAVKNSDLVLSNESNFCHVAVNVIPEKEDSSWTDALYIEWHNWYLILRSTSEIVLPFYGFVHGTVRHQPCQSVLTQATWWCTWIERNLFKSLTVENTEEKETHQVLEVPSTEEFKINQHPFARKRQLVQSPSHWNTRQRLTTPRAPTRLYKALSLIFQGVHLLTDKWW